MTTAILPELEQTLARGRNQSVPEQPKRAITRIRQAVDRRTAAQAHAMNINGALLRWFNEAWANEEGHFFNIDIETGEFEHRYCVPSGTQYRSGWGLSSTEAKVLKRYILNWQADTNNLDRRGAPIFIFDGLSNRWCYNIFDYYEKATGEQVLKANYLKASDYQRLQRIVNARKGKNTQTRRH